MMPDWLEQLLAVFGGTALALVAFVVFLGRSATKLLADMMLQRTQRAQDSALEAVRTELAQHNQVLTSALASRSSESLVAQERRVKAVEALWEEVLHVRRITATALLPYMVLVPSEYAEAFDGPFGRGVPTNEEWMQEVISRGDAVDAHRPFVGRRLSARGESRSY